MRNDTYTFDGFVFTSYGYTSVLTTDYETTKEGFFDALRNVNYRALVEDMDSKYRLDIKLDRYANILCERPRLDTLEILDQFGVSWEEEFGFIRINLPQSSFARDCSILSLRGKNLQEKLLQGSEYFTMKNGNLDYTEKFKEICIKSKNLQDFATSLSFYTGSSGNQIERYVYRVLKPFLHGMVEDTAAI